MRQARGTSRRHGNARVVGIVTALVIGAGAVLLIGYFAIQGASVKRGGGAGAPRRGRAHRGRPTPPPPPAPPAD